jgi:hypothetical protein
MADVVHAESQPRGRLLAIAGGLVLAVLLLGTGACFAVWLDSRPLTPTYAGQVMEAGWKPNRPNEFHVRVRLKHPGPRPAWVISAVPVIRSVEAGGQPLAHQRIAIYWWQRPNPWDISIEGKLPSRPQAPTRVNLQVSEVQALPWWKRLLPRRWGIAQVEIRYPLQDAPTVLAAGGEPNH